MKKIKYLLFIIPLLFIFIGSSKAYDFTTTVNEQSIVDSVLVQYPDFDISLYPYQYCYVYYSNYSAREVRCWFISDNTAILDFTGAGGTLTLPSPGVNIVTTISDNQVVLTFYDLADTPTYQFNFCDGKSYTSSYCKTPVSNFDKTNLNNVLTFNSLFPQPEPEPETPTIENKIYLPDELQEGNCPIILNKDTIRVYENTPVIDTLVNFTDYFINSHYIKQTGQETLTNSISCLSLDNFTTAYVYRFDFDKIIVIFVSILFLIAYPVMKILHAFFIGFKRR